MTTNQGPTTKIVRLGFIRVQGGDRVMWFTQRDQPTAQFVQTLERIGAAPIAVRAAKDGPTHSP
jgi:hypothetical protein